MISSQHFVILMFEKEGASVSRILVLGTLHGRVLLAILAQRHIQIWQQFILKNGRGFSETNTFSLNTFSTSLTVEVSRDRRTVNEWCICFLSTQVWQHVGWERQSGSDPEKFQYQATVAPHRLYFENCFSKVGSEVMWACLSSWLFGFWP